MELINYSRNLFRCTITVAFVLASFNFHTTDSEPILSKLILYKGGARYQIDGKNCPVGVTFKKPERFSCACLTGVWAFYETSCSAPTVIIGGENYCFPMPSVKIHQVSILSSPVKMYRNVLTVFEPDMTLVKTKVYRTLRINTNHTDEMMVSGGNWTLISPNDHKAVCIIGDKNIKDHKKSYCIYKDISNTIPRIEKVMKGCQNPSYHVMSPLECLPIANPTSEEICRSPKLVEKFRKSLGEKDEPTDELFNTKGTFRNFKTEQPIRKKGRKFNDLDISDEFLGEPNWLKKQRRMKNTEVKMAKSHNKSINWNADEFNLSDEDKSWESEEESFETEKTPERIKEIQRASWNNLEEFLATPISTSEPLILNEIRQHEKMLLRNLLNLETADENENKKSSQLRTILQMSKEVVQRICPIVSPEYFDLAMNAFLNVQYKDFHFRDPYLSRNDFLRLYKAMDKCRKRARPFDFVKNDDGSTCDDKAPQRIIVGKDETNTPIEMKLEIPEQFESHGTEPIIESVWKLFITAHSYCYQDFSDFFNDHHLYTVFIIPVFSNAIQDIWLREKAMRLEYGGLVGDTNDILDRINKCTMAARITSEFPMHMTRPMKTATEDLSQSYTKRRRKRDIEHELPDSFVEQVRTKRLIDTGKSKSRRRGSLIYPEPNSFRDPWKMERTIWDGLGYCLKKYNEPRIHLHEDCSKKITPKQE